MSILFKNSLKIVVSIILFSSLAFGANRNIHINIQNTPIKDLIKLTSKIIKKNILFTGNISGNVDFIQNVPLKKNDIMKVLIRVLEAKGFTIVIDGSVLRVVSIKDVVRSNLPIYTGNISSRTYQMVTKMIPIKNKNIDYMSLKVKHLLSKNSKLVTDKFSNTMIVTDFPQNIRTIEKIIKYLTKDEDKKINTIELKNVLATSILGNIKNISKSIFDESSQSEKVDIFANSNINAIVLIGKKKNVERLSKHVNEIDEKGTYAKKSVEVIPLKSVDADQIAKTINSVISKKKYISPDKKPFVASDKETNSIILMGPNDEIASITELIKKLDKDRMQVYVKVKIIEVSQTKLNDIGIKYGLDFLSLNSDGLLGISASLSDGFASPYKSAVTSTISGLDINNLGGTKALALGAGINFLKQNGAINIVSEPSILCLNNKESSIYAGRTISIKTNDATTGTTTVGAKFAREDVGLKLTVKPRISNDNKVTLDIKVKIEDVEQTQTNDQPNTSKKEIKATTIVANGENIILGGLIKSKNEKTEDKVPFLGDIPILGVLFKNKRTYTDKQNLVIILTPYIIKSTENVSNIREQLSQFSLLEKHYYNAILKNIENKNKNRDKKKKSYKEKKAEIIEKLQQMKTANHKSNKKKIESKEQPNIKDDNITIIKIKRDEFTNNDNRGNSQ
jgi:general secretion pathway protein D